MITLVNGKIVNHRKRKPLESSPCGNFTKYNNINISQTPIAHRKAMGHDSCIIGTMYPSNHVGTITVHLEK